MTTTDETSTTEIYLPPIVEPLGAANLPSPELQHRVEQFLYDEADLLDSWRYWDWLELFDSDIRYWMPTRTNRLGREVKKEIAPPDEAAYFDETYEHLLQRVRRLDSGQAWSEDPPSRTRHMITNVRIRPAEVEGELHVQSSFFLYRTRLEREVDHFVGKRFDLLRPADTEYGWKIARRTILLDQATLLAKNLSVFF